MARSRLRPILRFVLTTLAPGAPIAGQAQAPPVRPLPLRQSDLSPSAATVPLTLEDASRLDRWIGAGVRDVRWAPDGTGVYFRWPERPTAKDDPEADPWWRVDAAGRGAEMIADSAVWRIPAAAVEWNRSGTLAAWESRGRVAVWESSAQSTPTRIVAEGSAPARHVRMVGSGDAVDFMLGEDLYRWSQRAGSVRRLTRVVHRAPDGRTDATKWLADQQVDLFDLFKARQATAEATRARETARDPSRPQAVPIDEGTVEDIQASPDGRYLTIRTLTTSHRRSPTLYMDYATMSGYAESKESRGKVGEPRDVTRLGVIRLDAGLPADSAMVRWITIPEAAGRPVVLHGPFWSVEGDRAAVEAISEDDHDLWIASLDLDRVTTRIIDHQHDDAWIGGPPIQSNYLSPGLLEWLPGGRMVFASEKGGWSHLHLAEPDGTVHPLTNGPWEVRSAALSRDRSTWILGTSREHPADDQLYTMPAAGGPLVRLTTDQGRSEGILSPDGRRLAVIYSRSDRLPDLWLRDLDPVGPATQVTLSGSDNFRTHQWLRPEIVSFPHPAGGPLWAGLYKPARPDPRRPAIVYVHGGGYRQFANRGWSVYGFSHASHYGMINWLVQQGYTVLDFDYRGSAGYGRDYRTDIYQSMGAKDVDGAVAATKWLVATQGVDPKRIGIYGVSYGGFMTLMSLFRYPGVFAAGISAAGVTDWAHYSDEWTSRVLGLPRENPAVYRATSPTYQAAGLRDPLLIEHGVVDDNVEFQDAARLVLKLVELGKPFEVIYYPTEPHVIEGEASLADFHRRLAAFFKRHLLDRGDRP